MNMKRLTIMLVLSILFIASAANFSQEARSISTESETVKRFTPLLGRPETPIEDEAALRVRLEDSFGQMPLLFVENQGQWDEQVSYAIQGSDKTLYFTPDGVTFALTARIAEETEPGSADLGDPFALRIDESKPGKYERWAVKLDFVGANPDVRPRGLEKDEAVISYFKGQPEEWRTGLPTYRRLVYQNLWPGIDLVYEGTVNRLKYHFVVRPGADPGQIRLAYRGATNVYLNNERALVVETPAGRFQDDTPIAYQKVGGNKVPVEMDYRLEAAESESQPYYFELGSYDPSLPLILDPAVLVYAGYIGGSGWDQGIEIAVDGSGNAYLTGFAYSNEATFPVTAGPGLTYDLEADAFVAKVNTSGTGLVYAGYIGGSSWDYGYGIAVDGSGNAYVTGSTSSSETTFPVTVGPDLTHNGSDDAFVAKINPSGTGLIYSGYIGGSSGDYGYGIAVDGSGNAHVTGYTSSSEGTFPVIAGPDLTFNGGDWDAFVAKVNPAGGGLVYAGYIGGIDVDYGEGITVDGLGNAYITGWTGSNEDSFPISIGPDLTHNGDGDAFVAKVRSIPVPPANLDIVGTDSGLVGTTYHFSATTAPITTTIPLTYVWQGTGQPLVTHTGGLTDTAGFEWDVSGPKNITVTVSNDFGAITNTHVITIYTPVLADFLGQPISGPAPLEVTFTNLSIGDYTTCDWDFGDGEISSDCNNPIHTYNNSDVFTVTLTVTGLGGTDLLTEANYITVYEPVQANFTAAPISGTVPLIVKFSNLSAGDYNKCSWNFGDGTTTSNCTNPSIQYTDPGVYTITLAVSGLGGTDALTRTNYIAVYEPVQANFTASPTSGNPPLLVSFTNLSTGDFTSCLWELGDGETSSDCDLASHTYIGQGVYTVTLTATGPGGTDEMTRAEYIDVQNYGLYLPTVLKP